MSATTAASIPPSSVPQPTPNSTSTTSLQTDTERFASLTPDTDRSSSLHPDSHPFSPPIHKTISFGSLPSRTPTRHSTASSRRSSSGLSSRRRPSVIPPPIDTSRRPPSPRPLPSPFPFERAGEESRVSRWVRRVRDRVGRGRGWKEVQ